MPSNLTMITFLMDGGWEVIITTPVKLASAIDGRAGTRIVP